MAKKSSNIQDILTVAVPIGGAALLAYLMKKPSPPTAPIPPITPIPPSPPSPPTPPAEKQITLRITHFPAGGKPGDLLKGDGILSSNFSGQVTLKFGIKDYPTTYASAKINISEGDNQFHFGILIPRDMKSGNYIAEVIASDGVEASTTRAFTVTVPSPPPVKPQVTVKNAKILKVPNGYVNWGGDSHVVLGVEVNSNTDTSIPTRVYAYIYNTSGNIAQSVSDVNFPIKKGDLTYSFDMLFKGSDTMKFAPGKSYPIGIQVFLNGKKVYENHNIGTVLIKTTPQPAKIRINKLWIEPSNPKVGQGALVHSSISARVSSGTTVTAEVYHDNTKVASGSLNIPAGGTIDVAYAIPHPYVVPKTQGTHTVKLVVYSDHIKADEKSITYTAQPQGSLKVDISSVTSPMYPGSIGTVKLNVYLPTKTPPTIYAYIDNSAVIRGASPSVSSTGWNLFTYRFTVPALGPGTHTFRAIVTQGGSKSEASKSVTIKQKTAKISIHNITIDKNPIKPGEAYHVDFDVYNDGDVGYSGQATAYLQGTTRWSLGTSPVVVNPHSHVHIRLTGVYPDKLSGQIVTVVAGAYNTITVYSSGPRVKVEKKTTPHPSPVSITNFSLTPISGNYRVKAGSYGSMKLGINVNTSRPDTVRVHVDIVGAYGKMSSYDYGIYTGRVTHYEPTVSYPIPKNWKGGYYIQAKAYAVSSTGDKKYASTHWNIEVVR